MTIPFVKFQGTGNDFVIIDNRSLFFPSDNLSIIQQLTDRKFGIGADGLMLIENHESVDFRMRYYNADGSESLCGNGSRCAIKYAQMLRIIENETVFETTDGIHKARIDGDIVHFELRDQLGVQASGDDYFINNGSPHHIQFVREVKAINVFQEGQKIRYSTNYQPSGTNVNFVEIQSDNEIFVRTYERGVENETLSCGTGVTASALAASIKGLIAPIQVKTLGGNLKVDFTVDENQAYRNIYLSGPAKKVFSGSIEI